MDLSRERARRRFLKDAVGVGGAVLAAAAGVRASAAEQKAAEEAVSPTEDLMREHGVLRRILLVYGEVIRRVDANQPVPAEPVARAATLIRAFIEDYHERDEEEFIFPRFRKAGKMTGLVDVLLQQHRAGRGLTAQIQRLASPVDSGQAFQPRRAGLDDAPVHPDVRATRGPRGHGPLPGLRRS